MKKSWIAVLLLAAGLSAPAHAALLVTNLDQFEFGSYAFTDSAGDDKTQAALFTTGANAFDVTGATALLLNYDPADPVTRSYTAAIWTDTGGSGPGSLLASFDNSPSLVDNILFQQASFTSAGISLSSNTSYWLAITAIGQGGTDFNQNVWRTTDSTSESSLVGWTIADARSYALNLGGWEEAAFDSGVPMFSISGDPAAVPVPPTLALFGLGLAGIGAVRRRKLAA